MHFCASAFRHCYFSPCENEEPPLLDVCGPGGVVVVEMFSLAVAHTWKPAITVRLRFLTTALWSAKRARATLSETSSASYAPRTLQRRNESNKYGLLRNVFPSLVHVLCEKVIVIY